jgi:hypothetical protein
MGTQCTPGLSVVLSLGFDQGRSCDGARDGNSATVLLRDYRELTTPAKATEWFGVEL